MASRSGEITLSLLIQAARDYGSIANFQARETGIFMAFLNDIEYQMEYRTG